MKKQNPNRTTRPPVTPTWLQQPEPFPLPVAEQPCPAKEPMEELNRQVLVLSRQVAMLKGVLFKLMAEQIRCGNLQADVYSWLDCDQCRDELLSLMDDHRGSSREVH